jgi:hypothetical protein
MLVLTLAGCGGAPAGSASPSSPGLGSPTPAGQPAGLIDSCSLLSDQEIEAGTGYSVSERQSSTLTQVFSSVCDIELDDGGTLVVSVLHSGGRSMYENSFEPFIGDSDAGSFDEAITGLGDKAARSGQDDIMVLKDDVLFDIFYIAGGRHDTLQVVRYLAEVVVAKLPCRAVGCPGFTPPPAPSFQAMDVCSLLTDEEIETATGFKSLGSEPLGAIGGDAGCAWTLDTQPIPSSIQLTVMDSGGREEFDFIANELYETPPEHIPGLGDDAVKTNDAVYAVVGDRLLRLRFTLWGSTADPHALVVPLVELALSRLALSA